MDSLILLGLIVFGAYMVQSALGFGATVLAVAAAAFLYPIELVLPVLVTIDTLQCLYISARYRATVDNHFLFKRIVPMMVLGMPVGMALFHVGGERTLKVLFGVFVVVLAASELRSLRRRGSVSPPLRPLLSASFLFGGGITHGLYGSGGPMAIYVTGREIREKDRFRSTMSALWVLLNLILIGGFIIGGKYDATTARMVSLMLAPLVVGIVAGEWIHDRVRPVLFQGLVYGALLLAGVMLTVTA